MQRFLTAKEVASTLQVSLPTVYAYVSRGLLRSESATAGAKTRRYHAEDVAKLKDQKRFRHDPAQVANQAMNWGLPVLESALTYIADNNLWYRGQSVTRLAITRPIEDVAALLWTGDLAQAPRIFAPSQLAGGASELPGAPADLALLPRMQIALALAAGTDLAAYDLDPRFDNATLAGARILRLLAEVLAGRAEGDMSIAAILQNGWCPDMPNTARLFDAALILSADHELNTSSFAARVVASADAHLYLVVAAGLAAIQGFKHGGSTILVEALFDEVGMPHQARRVVAQRLRRGACIPGFGHRLYPEGDPRGKLLLKLATTAYPNEPAVALAHALTAAVFAITGKQPTLEFGLVTLARALHLPDGSALAIFALGRTVGWIGHALEQYQRGQLIRPRAQYTGPMGEEAGG